MEMWNEWINMVYQYFVGFAVCLICGLTFSAMKWTLSSGRTKRVFALLSVSMYFLAVSTAVVPGIFYLHNFDTIFCEIINTEETEPKNMEASLSEKRKIAEDTWLKAGIKNKKQYEKGALI